jgi:2,5-diamino-6-(ribosylamino)-4(3H)-pyrimidinone 5'-phosphate reductase
MRREEEIELPYVVVHVAVSIDGTIDGFEPDVARYYELASTWEEDVTLAGADTILAQEPMLADAPRPGPNENGPLLAVVDGRRRVTAWEALRQCGHWRDVVGLHADDGGRVDLAAALAGLEGDVVRVDSGGGLNGALLQAGLVDEVSLLVHPCIVGGDANRWHGSATDTALEPIGVEALAGGLAWLRYRVPGHRSRGFRA